MAESLNPAAPHHLPAFITAPGETDVLMVVMAVFLVVAVLAVGILFLRLHTLPERMAHRATKLQFEIVAVLGLLALFTHMHLFWVAGLLLAVIDIPDFGRAARPDGGIAREDRRHPARRGRGRSARDDPAPAIATSRSSRQPSRPDKTEARSGEREGADRCLSFFSAPC